jgi:hypothetical protein
MYHSLTPKSGTQFSPLTKCHQVAGLCLPLEVPFPSCQLHQLPREPQLRKPGNYPVNSFSGDSQTNILGPERPDQQSTWTTCHFTDTTLAHP